MSAATHLMTRNTRKPHHAKPLHHTSHKTTSHSSYSTLQNMVKKEDSKNESLEDDVKELSIGE